MWLCVRGDGHSRRDVTLQSTRQRRAYGGIGRGRGACPIAGSTRRAVTCCACAMLLFFFLTNRCQKMRETQPSHNARPGSPLTVGMSQQSTSSSSTTSATSATPLSLSSSSTPALPGIDYGDAFVATFQRTNHEIEVRSTTTCSPACVCFENFLSNLCTGAWVDRRRRCRVRLRRRSSESSLDETL